MRLDATALEKLSFGSSYQCCFDFCDLDTGQLFCRLVLNFSMFVVSILDSQYSFWCEYHRRNGVFLVPQYRILWLYYFILNTGDVTWITWLR